MRRNPDAIIAATLWTLTVLVIAVTIVSVFVIPTMVGSWRAQGLREVPYGLQILVDASDFSLHRGVWFLPILVLLAVLFTIRAVWAKIKS